MKFSKHQYPYVDLLLKTRSHMKSLIGPYGIKVSISEMEYGYSVQGNSQMVLDAEDVVHARTCLSMV
jgi:hypothetical protein